MKVSRFMQKNIIAVSANDTLYKVIKIIFNLGFSAVPVVHKKKLVGIITEQDILLKLFPTVSEYMADMVSGRNFNSMEVNMKELMHWPAKEIMNKDPYTIQEDAPIMKAQSIMLLHKFSHIPVVDAQKNLVGMISQGDIFKALVETEIPFDDNNEYHQWLASHYDLMMPWSLRLNAEIPSLHSLFKKHEVKRIVDVFCGTGEQPIVFAKKGYDVTGFNGSTLMHRKAIEKLQTLSKNVLKNLRFRCGEYVHLFEKEQQLFDAILFLGNSLAHFPTNYEQIVASSLRKLTPKTGIIVFQLTNTDKILQQKNRLQDFTIQPSRINKASEYAFTEFFDPPKKGEKTVTLTMSILAHKLHRWTQESINSTPLVYLTPEIMKQLAKKIGFSHIEIYGSVFNSPLFDEKFNIKVHDWMNVVYSMRN